MKDLAFNDPLHTFECTLALNASVSSIQAKMPQTPGAYIDFSQIGQKHKQHKQDLIKDERPIQQIHYTYLDAILNLFDLKE